MVFENPKYNSLFILSLWAFTTIIGEILKSVPSYNAANPGTPPLILQYLPLIMYSIFGVYVGICLLVLTYDELRGLKLREPWKNLPLYGIKSFATLVLIFGDLVAFISMEHDFVTRVFNSGNMLTSLQESFVFFIFPILGLIITWCLRNPKLEHETFYHAPYDLRHD